MWQPVRYRRVSIYTKRLNRRDQKAIKGTHSLTFPTLPSLVLLNFKIRNKLQKDVLSRIYWLHALATAVHLNILQSTTFECNAIAKTSRKFRKGVCEQRYKLKILRLVLLWHYIKSWSKQHSMPSQHRYDSSSLTGGYCVPSYTYHHINCKILYFLCTSRK
jgi:hypothetical protein